MLKRATGIFAAGALAVAGALVLAACILADPPAEIDARLVHRPMILRDSAYPTPTRILREWPSPPQKFVLSVDADPALGVSWQAFFDYDPVTKNQPDGRSGRVDPDPTNKDAGVREIDVPREVPDATRCHTFEILVAYGFVDSHVPDNGGGDSIIWFYAPTGDLTTCPSFDASVLDASDDADAGIFVPGGQDEGG